MPDSLLHQIGLVLLIPSYPAYPPSLTRLGARLYGGQILLAPIELQGSSGLLTLLVERPGSHGRWPPTPARC